MGPTPGILHEFSGKNVKYIYIYIYYSERSLDKLCPYWVIPRSSCIKRVVSKPKWMSNCHQQLGYDLTFFIHKSMTTHTQTTFPLHSIKWGAKIFFFHAIFCYWKSQKTSLNKEAYGPELPDVKLIFVLVQIHWIEKYMQVAIRQSFYCSNENLQKQDHIWLGYILNAWVESFSQVGYDLSFGHWVNLIKIKSLFYTNLVV